MSYGKMGFVVSGLLIAALAVACGKKTDNKAKTKATAAPAGPAKPNGGERPTTGADTSASDRLPMPGTIDLFGAIVGDDGKVHAAIEVIRTKADNKVAAFSREVRASKTSPDISNDLKDLKGAIIIGCNEEQKKALVSDSLEVVATPEDAEILGLKAHTIAICGKFATKAKALSLTADTIILKDAVVQIRALSALETTGTVSLKANNLVLSGKLNEVAVMDQAVETGDAVDNSSSNRIYALIAQKLDLKEQDARLLLRTIGAAVKAAKPEAVKPEAAK